MAPRIAFCLLSCFALGCSDSSGGDHQSGLAEAGAGGAASEAGSGGMGGAGGGVATACFESDGMLRQNARLCANTADCTVMIQPTCCGADLALGAAADLACTPRAPSCAGLGCPKSVDVVADDGEAAPRDAIQVECQAGKCRSFVPKDGSAPGNDGSAPGNDGSVPGNDGSVPGNDGSVPKDGAADAR